MLKADCPSASSTATFQRVLLRQPSPSGMSSIGSWCCVPARHYRSGGGGGGGGGGSGESGGGSGNRDLTLGR